jgi:hypothetical protein
MHILRRSAALLAFAALAPATPALAQQADDLLVMPFACNMVGGRPLLSPAPEQSHRIIGRREQRSFNACSQVNPSMCRTWTVHRFTMDCEGVRVPWIEVVAAAEAELGRRRAWVEDGRLVLRMEPSWDLDPDDPCGRNPAWLDPRMRRYCADRRDMGSGVVEMPPGFAPMLSIDGIFVKASPSANPPPVAATPPAPLSPPGTFAPAPPPKAARAEPPPLAPAPEPPPSFRAEPPRDTPQKEASAKALPPPVIPAPSVEPAPPKVVPPAPPPAKESAAKAPVPPAPTADSAAKPGTPLMPKIINRPDGGAEAPATPEAKTPPAAQSDTKPASPAPPAKETAAKAAPAKDEPTQPKVTAAEEPVTVSLLSVVRSPATIFAFGFAALAAGVLAVFAVVRRRELANAGRHPRDFASVPLDGRPQRGRPAMPAQCAIADTRGKLPPNAAASAMNRVPMPGEEGSRGTGVASQLGDRMPRTRSEALQVLGMGVTPSANVAALKKIVDGLRLSWHPDLAKDEADRQMRELRIKQINAAWEIIQGKRGEI